MKKASEFNRLRGTRWPFVFCGANAAWRSLLTEIPAEGSTPSRSLSGIDSPGAPNITVFPEGTSA